MRVAILTYDWPTLCGGGVAALCRVLARGLAAQGVQVEVWTRGGGGRDAALAQAPAEPYPVLGMPGRSFRRRGARAWRPGVEAAVARFRPDAVIASTWDPVPGLEPLLPHLSVFAHGRDVTGRLDPARERQRAVVLSAGHRWFCLTDWMAGELTRRGVPGTSILRVPAAVDDVCAAPRRVRTDGDPLDALCVGRLIPRKGQDTAIAAAKMLGPRVRLRVVGDGPDRPRLEGLAQDAPGVSIEGYLSAEALRRAWSDAEVLVMPCRDETGGDSEGYGLVYLEAGARGLPTVGGRVCGAAEAIVHGETGLLVDDPTEPAAVATALRQIAALPDRGAAMGARGRARYERCGRPSHLGRAVAGGLS